MKYVQPARRELRLRTIFNLLGPLTNPAHASAQVVGVYSLDLVEKMAEALRHAGPHRALVVHGLDGLDEITITATNSHRRSTRRQYPHLRGDPGRVWNRTRPPGGHFCGDANANAAMIRDVLAGTKIAATRCDLAKRSCRPGGRWKSRSPGKCFAPGKSIHRFGRGKCQTGSSRAIYNHVFHLSPHRQPNREQRTVN